MRVARESRDPQVLAPGLCTAALVAWARGEARSALEYAAECESFTRGGSPVWRSVALVWPVRVATGAGEVELAKRFLEGSENESAWERCARVGAQAMVAEAQGELQEAAALYREAAARWLEYGSVVEQAYSLLGLGRCADAAALRDGETIFARLGASPLVGQRAALRQQQA